MSDPLTTAELLQRLRGGDPRAAEELFARYAERLTRLADQHLGRRVAARIDGADVVQSVFRTFFRRSARGEFQIDGAAGLWKLLAQITLRKARAKARHHTAEMRDARAEAPGGDAWLPEALAAEPGPDEAVALVDLIDALPRGLPAVYGRVLELRLGGHSVAEIAQELGVSRQTVYRALELLQQRLASSEGEGQA